MSAKRKIEVYLNEDVYERYLAHAQAAHLSVEALVAEIAEDHLIDESVADEVLRRQNDPQPAISLEEMRRRLTS